MPLVVPMVALPVSICLRCLPARVSGLVKSMKLCAVAVAAFAAVGRSPSAPIRGMSSSRDRRTLASRSSRRDEVAPQFLPDAWILRTILYCHPFGTEILAGRVTPEWFWKWVCSCIWHNTLSLHLARDAELLVVIISSAQWKPPQKTMPPEKSRGRGGCRERSIRRGRPGTAPQALEEAGRSAVTGVSVMDVALNVERRGSCPSTRVAWSGTA